MQNLIIMIMTRDPSSAVTVQAIKQQHNTINIITSVQDPIKKEEIHHTVHCVSKNATYLSILEILQNNHILINLKHII